MAIEVGSLSYVSTLENQDFQAKSKQDIDLIVKRLQLTGDTSGIEKYAASFKAANRASAEIQKELNKILEEARQRTEALGRVQKAIQTKPAYGPADTAKELELVNDAIDELESGETVIAGLNAQLEKLNIQQQELNANFTAGLITSEEYTTGLQTIALQQSTLVGNIQRVNDSFSSNTVIQEANLAVTLENTAANEANTVSIAEEAGALELLKIELKELQAIQLTTPAEGLAIINAEIQQTELKIKELSNVGKLGFDEMGVKIKQVAQDVVYADGTIGHLKQQIISLNAQKLNLTGDSLRQVNTAIQDAELNVARLSNVGKTGFDEFGNVIQEVEGKTNSFTGAVRTGFGWLRKIAYILPGIGIAGLIAFAINPLIDWIKSLDIVGDRLNQRVQDLKALKDVLEDAAKKIGEQIAPLKQLYDTSTDVTKSMKERIAAAEELRDTYPSEFQNASDLDIINGKLKGSYDALSQSVIEYAKSQAATTGIIKAETERQEALFNIDQNNLEKYNKYIYAQKYKSLKNNVSVNSNTATTNPYYDIINEADATANEKNKREYENKAVADKKIAFLEGYTKNITKKSKDLSDANKLLGDQLQNFNNLISGTKDKTQLENVKKALQIKLDSLAPGDSQIANIRAKLQQVDDLIKKTYDVKPSKSTDPALEEAQKLGAAQLQLLQSTDALKGKYASKDEVRLQKQLDDVKASFTQQNNAIEASNVKYDQLVKKRGQSFIDAYNANPSNVNKIGKLNALTSQDLANAQAEVVASDSIITLRNQISEQKAIFKEYEDYKVKNGKQAADQLFKNDIKEFDSYISYLKSLTPTEAQLKSTDPLTKATASKTQDLLRKLTAEAQKEQLIQQQKYLDNLVSQEETYLQKSQTLIEVSNENIALLQKQYNNAQTDAEKEFYLKEIQQTKDNLEEQLTSIQTSGFERQAIYKELFTNLNRISTDSAKKQIDNAIKTAIAQVLSGKLTHDAFVKIITDLTKLKEVIGSRDFDKLTAIGDGITKLADGFTDINTSLHDVLSGLGSAVSSVANVGKAFEKMKADAGDATAVTLDKINLIATGVAALSSLIGGLFSAASQRKKDAEDYYNSVIAFQSQYNVALDEQVRLQYQTAKGSIFFTDTTKELNDATKAYHDAQKQYNDSLVALQKGQAIVGQKNSVSGSAIGKGALNGATAGATIGALAGGIPGALLGGAIGAIGGAIAGLFGGKKKTSVLQPLLDTYPQLIDASGKFNESLAKSLVANNQVSDATKVLLNNTIAYYDEEQTALDQITSSLKDLVGELGTSISNSLVTAFENGTDAAKAFSDTVSQILSNIIQQDLFVAIFGDQLAALQSKLTSDVLAGGADLQNEIIADITDFYKNTQTLVPIFQAGLQTAQNAGNAQGLTLFKPTGGSSSGNGGLTGQITASITESTAQILEGSLKGIQLNTLTTNNILEGHSLSLGQMVNLAQDQLTSLLSIQLSVKVSADNSILIVKSLSDIAKNTSSSASTALRAAGFYGYAA